MINRIKCDHLGEFGQLVKETKGLIDQLKNKTTADMFKLTYFDELDRSIRGLELGKVTAVVGRPWMGKTIFTMNIVRNFVSEETPVLVISLSISKEEWTQLLLCSTARVDLHKTRSGFLNDEEIARLSEAAEKVSSLPLFVVDEARRLKDIKKIIDESIKAHHIELIVIDGMSDIYGSALQSQKGRGRRYEKQLKIIKEMAVQWKIPVLITQTLSRRIERNPHVFVPKYEYGLKEGNLFKNVDRILHIYREEYYRPKKSNKGQMEIRIPSMSFGESDRRITVHFDCNYGLIQDNSEV